MLELVGPPRELSPESLLGFLVGLGETPDAVAESLLGRGCVGEPEDNFTCPTGIGVAQEFGLGDGEVWVGELGIVAGGVAVTMVPYLPGGAYHPYLRPLSRPVTSLVAGNLAVFGFIDEYDSGRYPALCLHRCQKCGHGLSAAERHEAVPNDVCPRCVDSYYDYTGSGWVAKSLPAG